MSWQPSATFKTLKARARLLQSIRHFFSARDVLEVDTPLLCRTSVTDPHIESIEAKVGDGHVEESPFYLQTSPEFAMKRLLAAGSGAIYQISKAFRQGERGRFHQPEFTLLEWYRVGFDHHDLMAEMDSLLQSVLDTLPAEKISYADLFTTILDVNPHSTNAKTLAEIAKKKNIACAFEEAEVNTWLDLLMTHCIEPTLGLDRPTFVYDFPVSQAALARIQSTSPPVASRFEVYINGIELANGFHELADAKIQRARFEANLVQREKLGSRLMQIDEKLLAALAHGLPDCAGVALGVDRLLMVKMQMDDIASVVSFDHSRV